MSHTLTIDLRSDWHAGGGRGQGAVLDAVVHRDASGLPVLPGRHLKGLLREALERAADWGWEGYTGLAAQLFGKRSEEMPAGTVPRPGSLRLGDGRLPGDLALWLGSEAGQGHLPKLYRGLYSTAVDHATGSARDRSLRGIEVCVPLTLHAPISLVPGQTPPADWAARLQRVLPLIDAVGAHRSRGLGRALLSLEEAA